MNAPHRLSGAVLTPAEHYQAEARKVRRSQRLDIIFALFAVGLSGFVCAGIAMGAFQ